MCIYRCFFFSPSWTSHLHCRTLQEKRGGHRLIDIRPAQTCTLCQKGSGTPPPEGGELKTQAHRSPRIKITHTHTKKTQQGALFTFRFKALIGSVTCQLHSIVVSVYKTLSVQNWIGMYDASQCSAIKPLIEQRCNGRSFGLASVQNGWVSKEGRIQLIEVDEEKEGGWKQEEDDKKGTRTSRMSEGGRGKTYIHRDSAGMRSRSAGWDSGGAIQLCQPHWNLILCWKV